MLFSKEAGGVMVIDFERAELNEMPTVSLKQDKERKRSGRDDMDSRMILPMCEWPFGRSVNLLSVWKFKSMVIHYSEPCRLGSLTTLFCTVSIVYIHTMRKKMADKWHCILSRLLLGSKLLSSSWKINLQEDYCPNKPGV
jgi:hypothetical protein